MAVKKQKFTLQRCARTMNALRYASDNGVVSIDAMQEYMRKHYSMGYSAIIHNAFEVAGLLRRGPGPRQPYRLVNPGPYTREDVHHAYTCYVVLRLKGADPDGVSEEEAKEIAQNEIDNAPDDLPLNQVPPPAKPEPKTTEEKHLWIVISQDGMQQSTHQTLDDATTMAKAGAEDQPGKAYLVCEVVAGYKVPSQAVQVALADVLKEAS